MAIIAEELFVILYGALYRFFHYTLLQGYRFLETCQNLFFCFYRFSSCLTLWKQRYINLSNVETISSYFLHRKLFCCLVTCAQQVRRFVVTNLEVQRLHLAGIVLVGLVKVWLDAGVGENFERPFVYAVKGDVKLVGKESVGYARVVLQ